MGTLTGNPESFWLEARHQRVCAACGRAAGQPDARGRTWHAHHVIDRQWLKRAGWPEWDPRNALRLCTDCHGQHEYGGPGKVDIELRWLTDESFCFAFEVMNPGPARVYLERHYVGADPRIEQHEEGRCPICHPVA